MFLLNSVLGYILMLGPLVLLHELGHYLVGRWCGVHADAFSIGFGREIFGWTDRRGRAGRCRSCRWAVM
jgi:regulator of sigma E protease